jgi:hypothetical protein
VASPRARSSRSSDIKLIASATVAVLLVGFFIAGAALIATRGSGSVVCGQLNIGSASDVRQKLQDGGPYFQTGGARCGFWLALRDGDIVAYKVEQPENCTLQLKRDGWKCGNRTGIDANTLATYPVSIQTFGTTDAVIVDLVPPGLSVTTTNPYATTTLPAPTPTAP